MLIVVFFFAAISAVMLGLLIREDGKNDKLLEENGTLRGKLSVMEERIAAVTPAPMVNDSPLTVEGIAEAIKYVGYVPDPTEGWIRFMIQGEPYYVETGRLPRIFILRQFHIDPKEWEMDILRQAAHQMSDDLVMAKATIADEADDEGCFGIRFFVAAEDRNYASFRDNLLDYIGLVDESQRRMHEIYDGVIKEKREDALALSPELPHVQPEKKIMS